MGVGGVVGGHRRRNGTSRGGHDDTGRPRGGGREGGRGLSQFVNRSAIKLANIDAMLGYTLTSGMRELEAEGVEKEDEEDEEHAEEEEGCVRSKIQNDVERRHPPHRDPFVFVDLCGAPGGFSEYLLYRRMHPPSPVRRADENVDADDDDVPPPKLQHRGGVVRGNDIPTSSSLRTDIANDGVSCYGFGMSLGGKNADGRGVPWDLDHLGRYVHLRRPMKGRDPSGMDDDADVNANDPIKTSHYRICRGEDGTGSVYVWDNVLRLRREIRSTVVASLGEDGSRCDVIDDGRPLADLVVADGGFDAQRDAVDQESIAHRLVVSQVAAAVTLLRSGGSFVLKMFGFRREGTRRILGELYRMFDRMTFLKPISSRPASAERYLVCCGYVGPGPGWDGLAWRERMMLEESPESRGPAREEYSSLESLMDSFDGEMAKLNLDACRSIVNYLDDKKRSVEGEEVAWNSHRYSLNPRQYEEAWQLRYSK